MLTRKQMTCLIQQPWWILVLRYKKIKPEKIDTIKTRAVSEMLVGNSELSISASKERPGEEGSGAAAVLPCQRKQRKLLGSFFKISHPTSTALMDREAMEMELEKYLLHPESNSETDPLQWRQIHQQNFKRVSFLAKRYLCILATSNPSERLFSTGGNIVTCNRTALKPETVNGLVSLAHNLYLCRSVQIDGQD